MEGEVTVQVVATEAPRKMQYQPRPTGTEPSKSRHTALDPSSKYLSLALAHKQQDASKQLKQI